MPSGTTCNLFPKIDDCMGMNEIMRSINCLKLDIDEDQSSVNDIFARLENMSYLVGILNSYQVQAVDIIKSKAYNKVISDGFINDTLDNAKEAKKYFFGDYEMYKSYCSQWDGNNIKVRPIPEDVYLEL